jgi:hypothetical protein
VWKLAYINEGCASCLALPQGQDMAAARAIVCGSAIKYCVCCTAHKLVSAVCPATHACERETCFEGPLSCETPCNCCTPARVLFVCFAFWLVSYTPATTHQSKKAANQSAVPAITTIHNSCRVHCSSCACVRCMSPQKLRSTHEHVCCKRCQHPHAIFSVSDLNGCSILHGLPLYPTRRHTAWSACSTRLPLHDNFSLTDWCRCKASPVHPARLQLHNNLGMTWLSCHK